MKNHIIYLIACIVCGISYSQTTNPQLLVNVQNASQAEMDAYNPAELEEGMLVYNTDVNRIFEYTDTGWLEILTAGKVYTGSFIISATGAQSITGLPFQPTQIIFSAHANVEAFGLDNDNGVGDNNGGIANSFGSMNGFARDDSGTTVQGVIYVGGSGNSINDISRFSSNTNCIGIRYGNQNGDAVGRTIASLSSFDANGFTINTSQRSDNILVFFTAYR